MGTGDGKRASRRVVGFLVLCDIFSHPFFTNKNWLFRNPKGTLYSRHCLFKLRKKVCAQAPCKLRASSVQVRARATQKCCTFSCNAFALHVLT
jgi:hypothetical protein